MITSSSLKKAISDLIIREGNVLDKLEGKYCIKFLQSTNMKKFDNQRPLAAKQKNYDSGVGT